jgi:hypothetical protein
MRIVSTGRSVLAVISILALGCGPSLRPAEETLDPIPAQAEPVAADPNDELVYPESPSAEPEDPVAEPDAGAPADAPNPPEEIAKLDPGLAKTLDAAEAKASDEGRLVLETGRRMALVDRVVILGACWDYANAIYKRAGFPANKRKTVFNKPKTGPYADPGLFEPGDFLSYNRDEKGSWVHSAIFVDWTKPGGRVALMLTYVGRRQPIPALYARNDLSRVFRVVRPKP